MPDVAFDRFYRYDELTEILQGWAEEQPELVRVESIGTSYEGRDIWLATVTNFETGADLDKPALLVEANIHALEVTGCTAALHLIDKLLRGHGSDPKVTRCLDTRVFYIVPRLNPDGAELALADKPKFVRSSVRPYPRLDEQDGLYEEDIDGDGRILMMRIEDPNGAWKAHPDDPRLLTPRDADEGPEDGTFYRLLWEGLIRNYDGIQIKVAPPLEGLDLNRNFPVEWKPEGEQYGAGPFPLSEPETRAHMEAIVARPNITGYISYHTFSRRPSSALRRLRRRPLPDDGPARLQADRRRGNEAHRLSGDLDLPRVQVRPEDLDHRLDERLVLRPRRRLLRGRPSSGARSARRASRSTDTSSG